MIFCTPIHTCTDICRARTHWKIPWKLLFNRVQPTPFVFRLSIEEAEKHLLNGVGNRLVPVSDSNTVNRLHWGDFCSRASQENLVRGIKHLARNR